MIKQQTANLVVESFRAVSPQREALIESFYKRLFNAYPELQPYFANVDKVALRRKLLLALITVVDSLDDNEQLYLSLQAIATTHNRNHIQREHYAIFSKILVETLADFLPDTWSEATARAWEEALEKITDMIVKIGEHQQ